MEQNLNFVTFPVSYDTISNILIPELSDSYVNMYNETKIKNLKIVSKYLSQFFRHSSFGIAAIAAIILTCLYATTPEISAEQAIPNKVFSGVVVDSITGEPLPFANLISSRNSRENRVANENGAFIITTKNADGWLVSYTGYQPKTISFEDGVTDIHVRMSPIPTDLKEVVIKPKKEKYSKKNNPAVDFVNRLRKESKNHDPLKEDFYSYDKYEKTLLALNEFNGDFSSGFLAKKGKFLENYVDTSSWTGKRLLDFIIKEKLSTRIRRNSPGSDKEVTTAYRTAGIDKVLNQENMQIVLEDAIREIDIYGNNITVLQNRFVSPLSSIGPDFYKYYLTDTVYVGADRCIELSFAPHNAESMGFNGKIYVLAGDTTMFVKKITMRTPQDINLNYVENLFVNQSFEKDSLGNRHKTYDDVCIEMQIIPGTPKLYGRKTTVYNNFSYNQRNDLAEYYDKLGKYFSLDDYQGQGDEFWSVARMVPMTRAEQRMGMMMTEMRRVPFLYWTEKFLGLMESGYVRTGNPSKVDLGPLNTLVSFNDVEGARFRVGGMTMSPLNPKLFAKGYVAYGTKDRKFKYSAGVEYSFVLKKHHSYEWPRHGIFASYSYDTDMIGQHYLFTNSDNVFLSLKRMETILVSYRKLAKIGYVLELPNHFSVETGFRHETQEATQWIPFRMSDGRYLNDYSQSSFNINLRWAPGEKFIQGRTLRLPVNLDAWVFQLSHEYGPKGLFGSAFTLNKTELSIMKRLWFSAFGYTDIILKGGKVWSVVYYPSLPWANANLSYTIQPESFSLMNPMEFSNDQYAMLDFTYFGNGVLFNRLPLIKKLKIREAFTFKGLIGSLSDKNNPLKNHSLPLFPGDSHSRVMGKTPYMEIGAGIDNIFTFLRVDYVWRLTYRDTPGCDKEGIRVSLHFSF